MEQAVGSTPKTNRQVLSELVDAHAIASGFVDAYEKRGMDISVNRARQSAFDALAQNENPEAEALSGVLLYLLSRLKKQHALESLFLVYETRRGIAENSFDPPKGSPKLTLV